MPTKKTSPDQERQNRRRTYLDVRLGGARLTATKRTVRRIIQATKRAVIAAIRYAAAGGAGIALAHLLARH